MDYNMDGGALQLALITFIFTAIIHLIDMKLNFLSKYDPAPLLAVLEADTIEEDEIPIPPPSVSPIYLRQLGGWYKMLFSIVDPFFDFCFFF